MRKACKLCHQEFTILASNHIYCDKCQGQANYRRKLAKLMAMAKNRAKSKLVDFDLDVDFLVEMWEDQQGCCALTGLPFKLDISDHRVHPQCPSIDRIIPHLGYIKGNVRLITYHMNVALSEFGVGEFEHLIQSYRQVN